MSKNKFTAIVIGFGVAVDVTLVSFLIALLTV